MADYGCMGGPELIDAVGGLRLLPPRADRDAPIAVSWLNGAVGQQTMLMLGNPPSSISDTTVEKQEALIAEFLTSPDVIHWIIEISGQVVGAVWIHTEARPEVGMSELSLMIGDPSERGKGIGASAAELALGWAKESLRTDIAMRTILENTTSRRLILGLGGRPVGASYTDDDGLQ